MQISFPSIKEEITQAHNIIFEHKIDKLEKEPVYSFLALLEKELEKNSTAPSIRRKISNILMEMMQTTVRYERVTQKQNPFYCLLANYQKQLAVMINFTLPISDYKEWLTILALEPKDGYWQEFKRKCITESGSDRLGLYILKSRNKDNLYFNNVKNEQGLMEIAFLFG